MSKTHSTQFLGDRILRILVHPIQEWRPALHGDALEDGDAGKNNVVERGDAKIWTLKNESKKCENKGKETRPSISQGK